MKTALICVDVEYDFLPGGALGVPEGDQIIDPLIAQMADADVIVLTRDWHPVNHCSFDDEPRFEDMSWPVHCVRNTRGSMLEERLRWEAHITGKPVLVVHKGEDPDIEQYSAVGGLVVTTFNLSPGVWPELLYRPLYEALRTLDVDRAIVGGLALDYCVKETAVDLGRIVASVTVPLSLTRPVAPITGANAIRELEDAGIEIA